MKQLLGDWKRSIMCGQLSSDHVNQDVTIMGWVRKRRDLGKLIFVDLRDRTGIVQVVFDLSKENDSFHWAESIRSEYVLAVKGKVVKRSPENINPNMATGEVEVVCDELKVLSKAETPPIYIDDDNLASEALRLKYRYLDLRRPNMQKVFLLRHRITKCVRDYLDSNGFLEIETPMLTKSTPEGARDYLVPSRVHPGKFYALPQSPQLFKQLLMLSGFDRYFQVVKCFRDEDLRADRQPEFTQIDMEMSFVEMNDIITINEGLIAAIFEEALDMDIKLPFPRITYKEAMERFGSDKPDTRFGLELINISDLVGDTEFKVFRNAVERGGSVRGINARGAASLMSRRDIDSLVDFVKTYRAKGMAWVTITEDGIRSSIAKFFTEDRMNQIIRRMDGQAGDILFFIADTDDIVFDALGQLRLELGQRLKLIPRDQYNLLWVTEFPLLEYDEEEKRYVAKHHPFTSPMDEDIHLLETEPLKVRSKAYDIVLNGVEIGGGSIRIHNVELQERMLSVLGFTKEEAWKRFGFLLEAFKYGTPPHGGIAYGLDRLVMLLAGRDSIRDVIAFPKVQNASCPMTEAPSTVDERQLDELHVRLKD
jgi:aspartyl-tRNA synthetase